MTTPSATTAAIVRATRGVGAPSRRARRAAGPVSSGTAGSIPGRLARVTGRSDPPPIGEPPSTEPPPAHRPAHREAVQRWRLTLSRDAVGELQQREQLSAWESALATSGMPVAALDAAAPRPRFALAAPLPAGISGDAELVDLWLVERLPTWRVREALDGRLPAGYRLADLFDVWLGEPA